MVKGYKKIIRKYFEENSLVESNIRSFNNFIERELQKLVDEFSEIVPTIIPQEFENFKIKLGKISVGKPEIQEADGSKRPLYPSEARVRQITYSAPIFLEVSAFINDIQRENFKANIGRMPIMVKSKHCHLHSLKGEELVKLGEDPNDSGGYFIMNGNERVLMTVEDLASNKLFVKKTDIGPATYTAKLFSEYVGYRIPHTVEKMKDGVINITFSRFVRVPFVSIVKALGILKDQEIMELVSHDGKLNDDMLVNLYQCVDLKNKSEALDFLARKLGMQTELKEERVMEMLDRYFLPHVGFTSAHRLNKAYNLCKLIRRFLLVSNYKIKVQDQDHYMNKRLKMSGDLLIDLFRVNLRSLVQDLLYNFQRLVKRGKFTSLKIVIREQLLTSRINSAMATGTWSGGRVGISQNMDRTNKLATISNLQRVGSLLTSTQENFEARALHSTHWGRLCPVETPEGTVIGLRKNLALLANVTMSSLSDEKIIKQLEAVGLKLKQ